jgi:hypothetical protein
LASSTDRVASDLAKNGEVTVLTTEKDIDKPDERRNVVA